MNQIRLAGTSVSDLVTRARNGDQQAWDALVERYAPLIWSICRGRRLGDADAGDVAQRVWLQLVRHIDQVRDPAALPGWLATTTRRECLRVPRATPGLHPAGHGPEAGLAAGERTVPAEHELLAAERQAALREALLDLPPCCQQLITLLIQDPPVPYARISATLGIPVGGIGPTRRRCLDKLRRHPAIAALISAEPISAEPISADPISADPISADPISADPTGPPDSKTITTERSRPITTKRSECSLTEISAMSVKAGQSPCRDAGRSFMEAV